MACLVGTAGIAGGPVAARAEPAASVNEVHASGLAGEAWMTAEQTPASGLRSSGLSASPEGAREPLPRFSVGWYCPAPEAHPLREALSFGIGVLMIWAMAAWRRARESRA